MQVFKFNKPIIKNDDIMIKKRLIIMVLISTHSFAIDKSEVTCPNFDEPLSITDFIFLVISSIIFIRIAIGPMVNTTNRNLIK